MQAKTYLITSKCKKSQFDCLYCQKNVKIKQRGDEICGISLFSVSYYLVLVSSSIGGIKRMEFEILIQMKMKSMFQKWKKHMSNPICII